MSTEVDVDRAAAMLAALGNEIRVRIIRLLLSAHPKGMVVSEIQTALGIPSSTLSHHLEKLKNKQLVTVRRDRQYLWHTANTRTLRSLLSFLFAECCTRSTAVKVEEIVHLDKPIDKADKYRILVLCTGNSCRSQMAEGLLRSLDPMLEVYSAGTLPASETHPLAVQVMKESGFDISAGYPKNVALFLGESFDLVVTVCDDAYKTCPSFHGKVDRRIHIGFSDPAKAQGSPRKVLGEFRRIRDQIIDSFKQLYDTEIKRGR